MQFNNYSFFIVIFLLLSSVACEEETSQNTSAKQTGQTQTEIDTSEFFEKKIPKDSSYFALAMQYAENLDTSKSLYYLQKAYELNPDKTEYLYYLGYFNYVLGKFSESKRYFERLEKEGKAGAKVFYYLGGIALAEKKIEIALSYFQKAFEEEPLNPEYNYSLCLGYQLQGKLSKAKKHCELALQTDTSHIKSMELLFDIYLSEGQNDKALLIVDKILTMDNRQPSGRFLMGKYYHHKAHQLAAKKNFKESALWIAKAIHQYDLALAVDSSYSQALYNRAFAYTELKQYDKALKDFQKVLTLQPEDYRTYFMIGSIYEFYKEYADALQYYEKAWNINPDFKEAKQAMEEMKRKVSS